MSKIGRKPIAIPDGVTVTINGHTVGTKGPKGELSRDFSECLRIEQKENEVFVTVEDTTDACAPAVWGLTRSLISNMVEGVVKGFEKKMQIVGVGYKAQVQGKKLVLSLGFSHTIDVETPEGITFDVKEDIITVSGIEKQQVGQIAAEIRAFRKPEPYKGKGIRYIDEHVRRKAGKVAGAAEATA